MKMLLTSFVVIALAGGSAFADTSTNSSAPANNVSATTEKSEANPLSLDRFYVGYYGNLEGSSLKDFGSPDAVNANGVMTHQAMTFASTLTGAYMVTPDVGVGTYLEMNLTPVLGGDATMLDVGVTAFNKALVSYNGLTIFANAIVEAPTTQYDINRGMVAGLETTPYIRYVVPHSRFTVGAWTEVKNYSGSRTGKLWKTYYEPYIDYQLIPKLSAHLTYELEYDQFAGKPGFTVYETDLQPGVIWALTHHILVNPYVQLFTNHGIDRAAFGASLIARLL